MTVLSPKLQAELDQLVACRDQYHYRGDDLQRKTLISIIAPTAVGKSTVIREILRQCTKEGIDAGEVGTVTTRNRRPQGGDPPQYRTASEGITHATLIQQIQRGEVVNWSLFATGDLYATDAASYPATYNFLPLQPDSLTMLKRAGFQRLITIYLTAPAQEWEKRLTERRESPQFSGRIAEAVTSLEFAKTHRDHLHIIDNPSTTSHGTPQPSTVARRIINIMLDHDDHLHQDDPHAFASIEAMLQYAKTQQKQPHGTTA